MDASLLVSAAVPTLQILLMGTAGAVMGRKGILDPAGRQTLSQLIFWVFVPCLTFSKLARSVDLGNLAIWWFLPVNILLSIMLGFCLGWIAVTVLRPPVWLRPHIMCATAIGNVGNLPMILVTALCKDNKWPFQTALPPGHCADRGVAYIAFGMWIAGLAQFTIAYNMLAKDPEDNSAMPLHAELAVRHHTPRGASSPPPNGVMQPHDPKHTNGSAAEGHTSLPHANGHGPVDLSLPLELFAVTQDRPDPFYCATSSPGEAASPRVAVSLPNGVDENNEGEESGSEEGHPLLRVDVESGSGEQSSSGYDGGRWTGRGGGKMWEGGESWRGSASAWVQGAWPVLVRWGRNVQWSTVFNAPTLSAFGGITVGCMPAVKDLFFGDNDPPLRLVGDALSMMGDAMIPSMMLLLGAVLHRGPISCQLPVRVILGVVFFRLLVMPLLGLGLVMGLHAIGVFHAPDALFMLVLLVSHSMPTAMQLGTVATLRKSGEAEVSALLFWQYMACLVTLPLALTVQRHLL